MWPFTSQRVQHPAVETEAGGRASTRKQSRARTALTARGGAPDPTPADAFVATPTPDLINSLIGTTRRQPEPWGSKATDQQQQTLFRATVLSTRCRQNAGGRADRMPEQLAGMVNALLPHTPNVAFDKVAFAAALEPDFIKRHKAHARRALGIKKTAALRDRLAELIKAAEKLERDAGLDGWRQQDGGPQRLQALHDAADFSLLKLARADSACEKAADAIIARHQEALSPKLFVVAAEHPEARAQVGDDLIRRFLQREADQARLAEDPAMREAIGWVNADVDWQRAAEDVAGKTRDGRSIAVHAVKLILTGLSESFPTPVKVGGAWRLAYYKKGRNERAFIGVNEASGERVLVWYDDKHVKEGGNQTYEQEYLAKVVEGFRALGETG